MIRIWISNKNRDRIEREFLADARNAPTGLFHTLAKEEVRNLLMRRVRRFTAVCIMMMQSIRSMKQRYSGCFWQTVLPFRIISGSPGLSGSVKRSFYLRLSGMKIFLSGRS